MPQFKIWQNSRRMWKWTLKDENCNAIAVSAYAYDTSRQAEEAAIALMDLNFRLARFRTEQPAAPLGLEALSADRTATNDDAGPGQCGFWVPRADVENLLRRFGFLGPLK